MNGLHETQFQFANFVLRDVRQDQAQTIAGIKANGVKPEQRMAIYRNNTRLGLTEALRDGYPVVNRLVGAEFFNYLAKSYIQSYPPKSGCLLSFGEQFAEFVEDFQPAHGLPYLPDTARLEWRWHEAFHEANATRLDISALATIDPDLYAGLGFIFHPSTRFLASGYPVLRIWQLNQDDTLEDQHINLDEGGCRLLIFRPKLEVEIISLNDSEYLFLTLLESKLSLNQAIEQVFQGDSTFDVSASLQHWVANGLLTKFYMA